MGERGRREMGFRGDEEMKSNDKAQRCRSTAFGYLLDHGGVHTRRKAFRIMEKLEDNSTQSPPETASELIGP